MHLTVLAPELSAISRTDSTWIMTLLQRRALDERAHLPALLLGQRTVLRYLYAVTRLTFVRLIMGLIALTNLDVLLVNPVHLVAHDFDDDGFVHLVAGHTPNELSLVREVTLGWGRLVFYCCAHDSLPARSRRIVSIRAMSLRALPSWLTSSS